MNFGGYGLRVFDGSPNFTSLNEMERVINVSSPRACCKTKLPDGKTDAFLNFRN